jgi:hypothetical protein
MIAFAFVVVVFGLCTVAPFFVSGVPGDVVARD